jgi:hypothetical protein
MFSIALRNYDQIFAENILPCYIVLPAPERRGRPYILTLDFPIRATNHEPRNGYPLNAIRCFLFPSNAVNRPPHPPFPAEHLPALLPPRTRTKSHLPHPLNLALAMIFH